MPKKIKRTDEDINNEIKYYESKISVLYDEIEKLKKEKFQNNKFVYVIKCIPDSQEFSTHYRGRFSSYENAKAYVPDDFMSYDAHCDCCWTYEIFEMKCDSMNIVDEIIYDLPYGKD